jgi:hypothetical protein
MSLESAISDLQRTLSSNRTASNWRLMARQQLSAVREALGDERFASWDGWLTARSSGTDRERLQLLARITALGTGLLDRLDVAHYRQKVHNLVYDSVSMEIGGSE